MGIDLKLLPIESENILYSHSILDCNRSHSLFDEIRKLESTRISNPISCFLATNEDGEYSYGKVDECNYGKPLKWVTVKQLLAFKTHEHVLDNYQNKAIWAYLECLPLDMKIVLFWC